MAEDLDKLKQSLLEGFLEAIEDIQLNYFRKIKKRMYMCASKCCDDETVRVNEYLQCVQDCEIPKISSHYYITSTFDDIKRRYNACLEKCDNGKGYDPHNPDEEGDDSGIKGEDLLETSFPEPPHTEYVMNTWFGQMDNDDLEYEDDVIPENKKITRENTKDRDTCSRLCTEAYIDVMNSTIEIMRRDLAARIMAKTDQASFYYDWSRANEDELPV